MQVAYASTPSPAQARYGCISIGEANRIFEAYRTRRDSVTAISGFGSWDWYWSLIDAGPEAFKTVCELGESQASDLIRQESRVLVRCAWANDASDNGQLSRGCVVDNQRLGGA